MLWCWRIVPVSVPLRRRIRLTGVVTAAGGLLLLAWLLRRFGAAQVWSGLQQVGWGLLLIAGVAGLRFLARAVAWCVSVEPPHRLRICDAFVAIVCGDTLGNVTPFGPLVGEPAKAAFARRHVALGPAVTALAIENIFYSFSAAAMIAAGMFALLFRFELPPELRHVGEASIAATIVLFAAALVMLWRQPALIGRALAPLRAGRLHAQVDRLEHLERELYTFVARRRAAVPLMAAAELGFHACGVLEIHLTLWLLNGAAPPLLTSFILETTNRLITVVFRFVPLRLGVDEAATALFTQVLGLGPTEGVTLAIVRKARMLIWMLVGALLIVRQGVSTRPAVDPS